VDSVKLSTYGPPEPYSVRKGGGRRSLTVQVVSKGYESVKTVMLTGLDGAMGGGMGGAGNPGESGGDGGVADPNGRENSTESMFVYSPPRANTTPRYESL